jgi:hypothetical protein
MDLPLTCRAPRISSDVRLGCSPTWPDLPAYNAYKRSPTGADRWWGEQITLILQLPRD